MDGLIHGDDITPLCEFRVACQDISLPCVSWIRLSLECRRVDRDPIERHGLVVNFVRRCWKYALWTYDNYMLRTKSQLRQMATLCKCRD